MNKKLHYAWVIVGCCCLLQAASTGIYVNCFTLYTPQIIKEFGFSNGDFSWAVTLRSLSSAVSMGLCAKAFNVHSYKKIYLSCGTICAAAFAAQVFFTQLWQWHVQNIILGFCLGFILTVPLNLMLQNWFVSRKGLALGLAMSASGLCGALVNPISSVMIESYGWRSGILMLSVMAFILVIPCTLFLLKWSPEEVSMEPYKEGEEVQSVSVETEKPDDPKMMTMAVVLVCLMYMITQYSMQISLFVDSLGLSVSFASFVMSSIMLGNLGGKMALGILVDRFGSFKVMCVTVGAIGCAFLLFVFLHTNVFLLVSGFFFGMSMSLASLSTGLIANECFSSSARPAMLSKAASTATVVSASFLILISYSYDLLHSYMPGFVLAAVLCAASIVLLRAMEKRNQQR